MPADQGHRGKAALARSHGWGGQVSLAQPGWVLAGLSCLVLTGLLTAVMAGAPSWPRPLDQRWLRWMLDVRSVPATRVAKLLNLVGGGLVMWIVRLAIAAALAVFVAAEACAELSIGPLKALVATVTSVALALILTRPGRTRWLALLAAAAWSVLIALSRTYLAAHWLTDVLAGLLIGAGWAAPWFGVWAPAGRSGSLVRPGSSGQPSSG
jgi:PAP2 superfamily protein